MQKTFDLPSSFRTCSSCPFCCRSHSHCIGELASYCLPSSCHICSNCLSYCRNYSYCTSWLGNEASITFIIMIYLELLIGIKLTVRNFLSFSITVILQDLEARSKCNTNLILVDSIKTFDIRKITMNRLFANDSKFIRKMVHLLLSL